MSDTKIYRTDYLFVNTNFIIGAGSVLNLGGNYFEFNRSRTPEEADARAIESDWGVVGNDIRAAIEEYKNIQNK